MSFRSRRWTFTSFHAEDPLPFTDGEAESLRIKYMIYGLEHTKDGQLHWQGYVEFVNDTSMNRLKEILHDKSAHCVVTRGTEGQNADYCSKEGFFIEIGNQSRGKGDRTDLKTICKMISEGKTDAEIMVEYPVQFLMYNKLFPAYRFAIQKDRTEMPQVTWIYGPSGCGKSHYPTEKHKTVYRKNMTKWWEGYEQQEAIVLDDYKVNGHFDFKELLILLDKYAYMGEKKGGHVKINSPYIYITHTEKPEDVFAHSNDSNDFKQLMRRMKVLRLEARD